MSVERGHKTLTQMGYILKKKHLKKEDHQFIERDLTFEPIAIKTFAKFTPNRKFFTYIESTHRYYLPRFWAIENFGPPEHDLLKNTGEKRDWKFYWDLLPHQENAWNAMMKQFCQPDSPKGGILSLPCGWGKTAMSIKLATHLGKKTIVIVNKEFLMYQWVNAIQKCSNAKVGIIQQNKVDVENKDIVIAMLHSLALKDYPQKVFESFSTVLVDECFPYKQHIQTENGPIEIGKLFYAWEKDKESVPRVWSFNEKTKTFELKRVTYSWKKSAGNLIKFKFSKNVVRCTENHPFLTEFGWKKAKDIEIGDLIIGRPIPELKESSVSRSLNEDQYQILLGSFLGDGHLAKIPSGRYRLSIIHGESQKDYCEWKAHMFQVGTLYIPENGYSKKPAYSFHTKLIDLDPKKIVPKKKGDCPNWILDEIDERGLAIWFMDDGSAYFNTIIFHVESFSRKSCELILKMLNRFEIEAEIKEYVKKSRNKTYPTIHLNVENSIKLIELILPYIHISMMYKIEQNAKYMDYLHDLQNNGDKSFNRIENIPDKLKKKGAKFKVKFAEYKWDLCEKCDTESFHVHNHTGKGYYYWKCFSCKGKKNKYISYSFDPKHKKYDWVNEFQEYGYVRITEKDIITKSKEEAVFDLEIEDNHNFIVCSGGPNGTGIVAHNCHHIGSEHFSKALPKVACEYTLGLSATPLRKDGLTQVFLNYLGPIFHKEKRDGSNRVWVKALEIHSTSPNYQELTLESTGTKDTTKMINNLANDEATNHLIIEICRILVQEKPRKILVLGQRREQLEWLQQAWEEFSYKNFHGKYATCGLYYGNQTMNKKQYWKMLEESAKCDIIWGTNHIAKEGLDIPDLNTLVMLNGGQDVEQAVGRILRKFHKDVPPTVIDLVYKTGNFPRHFTERRHYYDETNYFVQRIKLNLSENIESAYTCKPILKKYFDEYPEEGDPSLLKPTANRRKKQIPIANHPDAPPVYAVLEDPSTTTKTTNLNKNKPEQTRSLIVVAPQDEDDSENSSNNQQPLIDNDLNLLTESEDETIIPHHASPQQFEEIEPPQPQPPQPEPPQPEPPQPEPSQPKEQHTKLSFKKPATSKFQLKPQALPTATSFTKNRAIPTKKLEPEDYQRQKSKNTAIPAATTPYAPPAATNISFSTSKKSVKTFSIPST